VLRADLEDVEAEYLIGVVYLKHGLMFGLLCLEID
jgi:hypothetical protein